MKVAVGSTNKKKKEILQKALGELHFEVVFVESERDADFWFRFEDHEGDEIEAIQNAYANYLKEKGNLGYREKSLGIVKDDRERFLLVQLDSYNENEWNFPGGGIEPGETAEEAVLRELKEELGSDKFKIIAKSKLKFSYDWPDFVIVKGLKSKKLYKGQTQNVFLVKFEGKEEEIKPDPGEIRKVKWLSYGEFESHLIFRDQWKTAKEMIESFGK